MKKLSFAFLLIGSAFLMFGCASPPPKGDDKMAFCTQEAKLCPDGVSYVGRQGPYCEFAPCPEVKPEEETYSDEKLSFTYPALDSPYISAQEWPPTVTLTPGVFACAGEARQVGERNYCVTAETEGAAGSTYTTYNYLTNLDAENSMLTIQFTLRFVQCENYDEQEKIACESAQADLNVDEMIDAIAQSVKLL